MSRANYENDSAFESDVDQVAKVLGTDGKRELMFSLLRECRGCGQDPSFASTEYDVKHVRGVFQRTMICKVCNREVPIASDECQSIGRIVTLWNTTPLTIEGRVS
ncbi:hypothetical protein [Pseudomonas sp. TWP3-2]|uniref:hypothetical protein n=1 Tax=Pseudomonas sp. TWP3-2 TaxID=2804574 RepID=UPI003CEE9A9D